MRRPVSPARAVVALAAVAALATGLAGCGSGGSKPKAHASASVAPYVEVPSGVSLTAPGAKLGLGEHAVVGWHPRQGTVAALDLEVTRIARTTFDKSFQGWQISSSLAATTPYFVRAVATNVSDVDLGKVAVQLYAQDDGGRLLAAQPFTTRTFEPCHPTTLPATFGPGDKADLCFVYLVSPGQDLASVTFQPQADDAAAKLQPITWSGAISTKVKPPAEPKAKKSKKSKGTKKSKKSKKQAKR